MNHTPHTTSSPLSRPLVKGGALTGPLPPKVSRPQGRQRLSFVLIAPPNGGTLAAAYVRLAVQVASLDKEMELILVDSGTSSEATAEIASLSLKYSRLVVVRTSERNHLAALAAGCRAAQGDVVFLARAERPYAPEQIEAMARKIDSGYDIVTMNTVLARRPAEEGAALESCFTCFRPHVLKEIDLVNLTSGWNPGVSRIRVAHIGEEPVVPGRFAAHPTRNAPMPAPAFEDDKYVMVVDDQAPLRSLVRMRLELSGLKVREAHSGMAVLTHLRPDVGTVLMDLSMPGLNGMDCLRQVRARRPDVKVIMLTGVDRVESAVQAMKLGAFDYLRKPFNSEQLVATVIRALNAHTVEKQKEANLGLAEWAPAPTTAPVACLA